MTLLALLALTILLALVFVVGAMVVLLRTRHRPALPTPSPDVLERLEAHGAWLGEVHDRLEVERAALEELEVDLRARLVAADAAAQTRGAAYGRRRGDPWMHLRGTR
jgi:hypothetical protein